MDEQYDDEEYMSMAPSQQRFQMQPQYSSNQHTRAPYQYNGGAFDDSMDDEIDHYSSPLWITQPVFTQRADPLQFASRFRARIGPFAPQVPVQNQDASSVAVQNQYQNYQQDEHNIDESQYDDHLQAEEYSLPALENMHNSLQRGPSGSQPMDNVETQYSNDRGTNPRNKHNVQLKPVSCLPDIYRGIFKFGAFNAVQSTCFDSVVNTTNNMVISAPTSSGKTVLFELAVIRMLTEAKKLGKTNTTKCVYMAPTKALCSERFRDWTAKFDPLGIKCCELTGDTVEVGKGAWGDAKNASIIITTGEKWDYLTRNWEEHQAILSQIQLFLVDEVHILNESRGSTLEVVIARMKLRGSRVRFVFVSATVPNIKDVANWIGIGGSQVGGAKVYEFGEEYRPCQLTRHVYGIPRSKNQNDFMFMKSFDYRLFGILQEHSVGKPILVFCSTRKGTVDAAEQLKKEYTSAMERKQSLPWAKPTRIEHNFSNKRLADLAALGIGVHHAGLDTADRRAIEQMYMDKIIKIVMATSTLAVGVNLPAYMVVIKGVWMFQNGKNEEYSDLDIMQMLGRAGRPQFDKEGLAIIMCSPELEHKYRSLAQGTTVLESSLHQNLSEHLNSEIGLGTITNIQSAKEWLRTSFLFQRIQQNPNHYAMGKEDAQTWDQRMDDLVLQTVEKLRATELVTYVDEGGSDKDLQSTEYGDIMSKLFIKQSTMGSILSLPEQSTLRQLLEMVSASEELSDTKLRSSEKSALNELKRHNDIRFSIKKIEKAADKIFLIIQAILAGIPLGEYKTNDSSPSLDALLIFKNVNRVARAIVDCAIAKKRGAQLKFGLELMRCLSAKAWEDRPVVLRQLEQIGEKSLKVLAVAKITSFAILRTQDTLRLEALLSRRPPFGLDLLSSLAQFPQYSLRVTEKDIVSSGGSGPVEVTILVECGLEADLVPPSKGKKPKTRNRDMTAILTLTSDMDFVDFRRISTKSLRSLKAFEIQVSLTKPSQSIKVYAVSESVAGVTVTRTHKPVVPAHEFPTVDTRPRTAIEVDLEGLEDDPNFWKMDMENSDEEPEVPIRDLTQKSKAGTMNTKAKTTVLEVLDHKPKVRPDGKYQCNHACKEKQTCRHICCREGMSSPPRAPKKRAAAATAEVSSSSKGPGKSTTVTASSTTKKNPHIDRFMEQLETIHERTNVTNSLKLPQGHRIKVEPQPALSRTKKQNRPPLTFDIKLSDITDSASSTSSITAFNSICDDDDIPEPEHILSTPTRPNRKQSNKQTSSDTNYSNSEIDALIRAVPLDNLPNYARQDTSLSRKRQRSSENTPQVAQKRPKSNLKVPVLEISDDEIEMTSPRPFVRSNGNGSMRNVKNRSGTTTNASSKTSLFLEGSPDTVSDPFIQSEDNDQMHDAQEDLDHDYFNNSYSFFVVDNAAASLPASMIQQDDTKEHCGSEVSTMVNRSVDTSSKEPIVPEEPTVDEPDEYDDLEAWLGGAVEIVG